MTDQCERIILACGLLALACSLGALAAATGAAAFEHMNGLANLCAPGSGHCLACVVAPSCLVAALVFGGWAASLLAHRPGAVATREACRGGRA